LFGPSSEFGFKTLLPVLGFPATCSETDHNLVRHTLGFGFPRTSRIEKPLPFLGIDKLTPPDWGNLAVSRYRTAGIAEPA